jgi:hypothetical protein
MLQLLVLGAVSLAAAAPLPDREVSLSLAQAVQQLNRFKFWRSESTGWTMSEKSAARSDEMSEWQPLHYTSGNERPIPFAI